MKRQIESIKDIKLLDLVTDLKICSHAAGRYSSNPRSDPWVKTQYQLYTNQSEVVFNEIKRRYEDK